MNKDIYPAEQNRIEQSLSMIGSQIADAIELSQRAREMTANSELLLIAAQQELEALYISLGQQGAPRLSIYRDAASRP